MEGMRNSESRYDVVIIGGGPAGLTAGLYASRGGLKSLLLEGESSVSQITVTDLVENYPGFPEGINGYDLVERFKTQTRQFGLTIVTDDVRVVCREQQAPGGEESWIVQGNRGAYSTLAVILATGANWRHLGVPGEEAFAGKGVSYCATCDGPFYRDREVVVVGGGDTAVQEALFLTRFARKVTIVHRRDRLRATPVLQKKALSHERIEFAWNSVVEEIQGETFVEGVKIRNLKNPDLSRVIPADGAFVFVGLTPNTEFIRNVVDCDENGYILADSAMRTSAPGIFACGDCIAKLLRQVVTACGDAATAAFSAQLHVEDLKGDSYSGRGI
ncbi:thioredoxin reductase (NADPH) [Syntrophus gentianae]|uniref:Thioredoxin reductase n=1 Tax=Syntrophus gentianae TaxID=43775 RepID=A0A1H8BIP0_9BACT|nr:thioredoxin-disulfide reductase [Syntrophus gentianae]SEM81737.1 thioredoxin reductase (NADPH) [Syntrophus gentianae]